MLVACAKPAPAPSEAELKAEDRATLERLIGMDVRISQAMKEADEAAVMGDGGAAVSVVETRAKVAIDATTAAAQTAQLKTAWGATKRDELVGVLRDRRAEIPRYEEAATSGEAEKMLASVGAQAAIERRMLAVVAAVQEGR